MHELGWLFGGGHLRVDELEVLTTGLVHLTAGARRVHTTRQSFLLLVSFIVCIILDGLFFNNLAVVRLFNDLLALLLARGEKVLYGYVVLGLDLDIRLLFVHEVVLHYLPFLYLLR